MLQPVSRLSSFLPFLSAFHKTPETAGAVQTASVQENNIYNRSPESTVGKLSFFFPFLFAAAAEGLQMCD